MEKPTNKPPLTWNGELWRLLDSFTDTTDKPKFIDATLNYYFKDITPDLSGESTELQFAFRVAQLMIKDQPSGNKRDYEIANHP